MTVKATLLIIDLQNIFLAAKAKNKKIDLEKIWDHFDSRGTEEITRAYVFMNRISRLTNKKFEEKVVSIGYDIIVRDLENVVNFHERSNSVNIAVESISRINLYDKLILVSGDPDFCPLIKYIKSKGKDVEVWSIDNEDSKELSPCVDNLNFFDDHFFFKNPQVSIFGFDWKK